MTDEEFDEILAWQMTGWLKKKSPQRNPTRIEPCRRCGTDWHGLPKDGCPGSFEPDTPKDDRNSAAEC